MKNFLRLLTLALLLVMGGKAQAARLTAIVYTYTHKYQSVDAFNRPITLSEKITVNSSVNTIKFILFNQHPTTTNNAEVPTSTDYPIEQLKYMCDGTEQCMVVEPDYAGYGESKGDVVHPYMCGTLTARNLLDGLLSAIQFIKTEQTHKSLSRNYNYTFDSNYYTLNAGYSQGGYNALSFQKYLETQATQAQRDIVKLKKTLAGAGPHSQTYMLDEMEKMDDIFYPLYLPFCFQGMKSAFGESTMRGLEMTDIFTEEFLSTNDGIDVFAELNKLNKASVDMNNVIKNKFGGKVGFYDIIRPEYKDRNSKLYRTLRKSLEKCDIINHFDLANATCDITDNWVPSHPITFFHYTKDEVVPYNESVMAYYAFQKKGCSVTFYNAEDLAVDSYWAIKSYDESHLGYGTKFYLCILSGALR